MLQMHINKVTLNVVCKILESKSKFFYDADQILFSNFALSAATALESNLGRDITGVGIVFVCAVAVFCCGTSASGKLISTSRKHSLPQHFIL
jgi:hypothetical protein